MSAGHRRRPSSASRARPVEERLGDGDAVTRSRERLGFAQVRDRSSEVVGVAEAVEIDADFKVIVAMPNPWTQVEVYNQNANHWHGPLFLSRQ